MKKLRKRKKSFALWEKIFVIVSIVAIIVISSIYMYRLVYYYKLEHPKTVDNTLATHIIKKGTVSSGDGLYTFDEKNYYYRGKEVQNYLWYSGRMWRIVNIDEDGLSLITEDSQTSLVWGTSDVFEQSYVNNWLNNVDNNVFLNSLNDYESDLIKNSWCVGRADLENNKCNEYLENYSSLLAIGDYLKAGGKDSYLNNNTYFWTSNVSEEGKPWYVFNNGGINDGDSNQTYYSYGVRPVVKISRALNYSVGEGSVENPYQIEKEITNNLSDKSIGEYIEYSGYKWKVQSKNEDSVRLVLDGYITNNNEKILVNYNDADNYLNKTFYNSLSKENLVKCDFNTGTYNKNTSYNWENIYNDKINKYVGMLGVGTLFLGKSVCQCRGR